jgi:hypothetical protein
MTDRFHTSSAEQGFEHLSEEAYRVELLRSIGGERMREIFKTSPDYCIHETKRIAAACAMNDAAWILPEEMAAALSAHEQSEEHTEELVAYDRLLGYKNPASEFYRRVPKIDQTEIERDSAKIRLANLREDQRCYDGANSMWDLFQAKANYADKVYVYDQRLRRDAKEFAHRAIAGLPNPSLDGWLKEAMLENLMHHGAEIDLHIAQSGYLKEYQNDYTPGAAERRAQWNNPMASEFVEHLAWVKILFPAEDLSKYDKIASTRFDPRGTLGQRWLSGYSTEMVGCTPIQIAFTHPIVTAKKLEVPAEGGLILDGQRIGPKHADAVNPISEETRDRIGDVL